MGICISKRKCETLVNIFEVLLVVKINIQKYYGTVIPSDRGRGVVAGR
jgi:hypothetical protein